MALIGRFSRTLSIGRSHKVSQACVRPSYKTLYTTRCTVSPKQGLTNQCRREKGLGHLLLAAHGKYGFRLHAEALLSRVGRTTRQRAESAVGTTAFPAVSTRITGHN